MASKPCPGPAYEGSTDFAALFPERLGLNRDVLFIAFADVHALIRYAQGAASISSRVYRPWRAFLPLLLSAAWQQQRAISR